MIRKCTASLGICSLRIVNRIAAEAIGDLDQVIPIDGLSGSSTIASALAVWNGLWITRVAVSPGA